MAPRAKLVYRREAMVRSAQPESLDDLLRVTAPRERVFRVVLLVLVFGLAAWATLAT